MNRYEIRCTKEQTRKALELGAPIVELPLITKMPQTICEKYGLFYKGEKCYQIPTAEQMLGWLEEKRFYVEIEIDNYRYVWGVWREISNYKEFLKGSRVITRKEAKLAAIDAALEYLMLKDKEL